MLFSLIHTETGSFSRFRHFAFEAHRLIQSLFGYFHHNPSLMEERSDVAICISILCHQRTFFYHCKRVYSSSRACEAIPRGYFVSLLALLRHRED